MPTAQPMRSASRSSRSIATCARSRTCCSISARGWHCPGSSTRNGNAKYPRGYAQYIVEHERSPGVGLLAGWRGVDGDDAGIGAPNPDQLARYIENGCHWHREIPAAARYYKMANRDYLEWAKSLGFVGSTAPVTLQFYAETLQKFRLAAQGHGAVQPPGADRARVERYFDPLPFWYASLEADSFDAMRATCIHMKHRRALPVLRLREKAGMRGGRRRRRLRRQLKHRPHLNPLPFREKT